jgi:hypothetical protein
LNVAQNFFTKPRVKYGPDTIGLEYAYTDRKRDDAIGVGNQFGCQHASGRGEPETTLNGTTA